MRRSSEREAMADFLRRAFTGIMVVLLVVLTSERLAAENTKVRIAVSGKSVGFLDVWAAHEKGFFREHHLDSEIVVIRPDLSIVALHTGQIDFTYLSGTVIRSILKGFQLKVISTGLKAPILSLISKPGYKKAADLKGKTFAVSTALGTDTIFLDRLLRCYGLDRRKDVVMVQMGGSQTRFQSLISGRVDATALSLPYSILAKRQGFNSLGSAGQVLEMQFTGIGTTSEKIQQDREQVKNMIRAQQETMRWIKNEKDQVVRFIQQWFLVDAKTAIESYQAYLDATNENVKINSTAVKAVLEQELGESSKNLESIFQRVVDRKIGEEALTESK
jgi:ABC-type nitrate/sulfonate/bicarbonate transport system substrate-binding protein